MDKIIIEFTVEKIADEARLTAMYCFKTCNVNWA